MCSKVAIKVTQDSRLSQQTDGAAGYDLYASEYVIIEPHQWQIVSTNVHVAIPKGHVGMLCSRSGLAAKDGVFVLNSPGIIDSDYRGEIKVILANFGRNIFTVTPGDRIAQLVISTLCDGELEFVPVLDSTVRADGGLGSTGVRDDNTRIATETV